MKANNQSTMRFNTDIDPAPVLAVLGEMRSARSAHAHMVDEQKTAKQRADELGDRLNGCRVALAHQETAAAASGVMPKEPFPEESQITALERQVRVASASVRLADERVAASAEKLLVLATELRTAWRDYGREIANGGIDEIERVARQLADRYAIVFSVFEAFSHDIPGPLNDGVPGLSDSGYGRYVNFDMPGYAYIASRGYPLPFNCPEPLLNYVRMREFGRLNGWAVRQAGKAIYEDLCQLRDAIIAEVK
jgi:hypothetical protein